MGIYGRSKQQLDSKNSIFLCQIIKNRMKLPLQEKGSANAMRRFSAEI
jgi:hypothetical protein